ncbi:unnamed protein product (macronuclear) [Paramecium tetraurelia]|uniref:Transmembrane protein n=1 Tax=Paramecium tetraurelia TaxID=5888 RepID=A0DBG5_PARTE|nr:uncharacterized protein GSPATT00015277001 [Paramecium tetraurelia]CAK80382.1 unnamed protein product [Paramecium tetraurelia]|eukprot:XP_001447779.1 hypothetical protein (macronuclear) [Paramecium tetraurelia strain d4-2]
MSTSLESQILLAIWTMYQRNQISMEQKGCIKGNYQIYQDLLIRKDNNLYSTICHCKRQDQIEERLLDILNCIYHQFGLIRVLQEIWMLKKTHIQFSDQAINLVLLQLPYPNVIILRKGFDLRVQIMKATLLRISLKFDLALIIINEFLFLYNHLKLQLNPIFILCIIQKAILNQSITVFRIINSYSNYYQLFRNHISTLFMFNINNFFYHRIIYLFIISKQ